MLAIDIALLVGGGVVLVFVAAVIGGRVNARTEVRRRRQLGAQNAEDEKRRLDERCTICDGAIDPAHDVWDAGRWWHRACYRESVR